MPARPHHPARSRLVPTLVALLAAAALALVPATAAVAEPPVSFSSSPVLDTVGALSTAETAEVEQAASELYDAHGVQLFVAFVDTFSDPADRTAWAERTATLNGLGTDDVLLAVAVDGRQYQLSVADSVALDEGQCRRSRRTTSSRASWPATGREPPSPRPTGSVSASTRRAPPRRSAPAS
ncbi:TPM domain-containing protein [Rathayibacter tanaceti]|uniref:TPM domain-containing protein n=1 Tax=Rathayibacter tanaceti TaxID=1671680 RepID=A0A166HHX8_9MICO|nr:TPM domain-containing protein [Rathayibacter tanaceti]KZX20625.1 hypothetical protein ACH61_02274 [Rathayibacter tanaceti]